LKKYPLLKSL